MCGILECIVLYTFYFIIFVQFEYSHLIGLFFLKLLTVQNLVFIRFMIFNIFLVYKEILLSHRHFPDNY